MPSIKSATDNLYRELAINNGSTPPAVYKAAIELANAAHEQLTGNKSRVATHEADSTTAKADSTKPKAKRTKRRKSLSPSNERMDATVHAVTKHNYDFLLSVGELKRGENGDRRWQHIYAAVLCISYRGGAATHEAVEDYLKRVMPNNSYTPEYIRATTAALYRRNRVTRAYVTGTNKYAYSARVS